MRLVLVPLINLWILLWWVLLLPVRLLGRSHRPEYVRYRLSGDLPWRRRHFPRRLWFFRQRLHPGAVASIEVLRRQLEELARDPKLRGVIFEVDGLELVPAKRQALVQMFSTLRQAGKEVLGYGVSVSNGEYELLCAADRILLPAAGRVDLTGFAAELTALGSGLDRLGVKAHFIRRGDHKTAPELFTHAEPSPIQRETIERLLDERYARLVAALVRGRRLSEEEARARIDGGPYGAKRALAQGLIDGLCSEPDLPHLLAPKDRVPKEKDGRPEAVVATFSAWRASQIWRKPDWRPWRMARPVGVVPLNGIIAEGRGGNLPAGPVVAGSASVIEALNAARKDPRVPAVVLYVSSPGGSAPASEMILEAVRHLSEKKPVVAYFDRVAASGGYMAVCGAKEIWAGDGAVAGSIGVFGGKFEVSGLLRHLGIHRSLVTRGQNAGLLSPTRGFTDTERAALEAEIDETYQSFLEIVAKARGRTVEEIHARGEGRIFSAEHALAEGLVDRVGGFEDACRRALELAGRPAKAPIEVALFGTRPPRLGLLGLVSQLARTQIYALCDPWFSASWLGRGSDGV
ncbi:MAG: signal peptide peptidase SppA [Myxococcaceae bacterium]|nr:signal peptide peptidase SppA [Myxococcaceae bacterium]